MCLENHRGISDKFQPDTFAKVLEAWLDMLNHQKCQVVFLMVSDVVGVVSGNLDMLHDGTYQDVQRKLCFMKHVIMQNQAEHQSLYNM